MKETARRFSENEEIIVTASDFDRELAATKDFVRIEGDKAIYQNWLSKQVLWYFKIARKFYHKLKKCYKNFMFL